MTVPAKKERRTYADILAWTDAGRVELIDGELCNMAPPSRVHQEISGELFRQLANYPEGKPCRVYAAPFGVRLFANAGDSPDEIDTVVEPDISVVCDVEKLDKDGCSGAPDLVMEVLSPSTLRRDRFVKLRLYQRAGVREYWIVEPETRTVQVYVLENGILAPRAFYGAEDAAKVHVLDGCFVELEKVFAES